MELFVGRCISLEEKLRDGESLDGTLCAVVVARRSYSDPRTDLGVRWTALSDRDTAVTRHGQPRQVRVQQPVHRRKDVEIAATVSCMNATALCVSRGPWR